MSYQVEAEGLVASARPFGTQAAIPGLYAGFAKRVLDVLVILLAGVPVLTLILVLAAFVALDGGNPFYTQRRVGKDGRVFRIWKLRTMVAEADAVLETHLAADPLLRAHWDRHQKLPNDPRVTRVGQILRKTSLDELPQLYNVLLGDMSLVGPRPMTEEQRPLYPGEDYYRMRPGMTGLWQISARHDTSFAERAWYDGLYYRCQSLRTDLAVLARTVLVVMRGTGC